MVRPFIVRGTLRDSNLRDGNMSRVTEPRTDRLPPGERRLSLLAAATVVVGEAGARHASIDAISAGAGVTKPIVYRHFGSRAGLLAALVEHHGRLLAAEMMASPQHADWDEGVRLEVRAVLAYARRHPHAWRILFVEEFDEPSARDAQRALVGAVVAGLTQRYLGTPGFAPPDGIEREHAAELAATFVQSTVSAVVAWWFTNPGTDIDALAAFTAGLVRHGITGLWT